MAGFVGLDPTSVRDAASRLVVAANRLDDANSKIQRGLALADLVEPGLIRRLQDRSDRLRSVSVELRARATEIESLDLGMGGYAAEALLTEALRGLDSVRTIAEVDDDIANFDGPPTDPRYADLLAERSRLNDESYEVRSPEALQAFADDHGLTIEEAQEWIDSQVREYERRLIVEKLVAQAPAQRSEDDIRRLADLIGADAGADPDDRKRLTALMLQNGGDLSAAVSTFRVEHAAAETRRLLHVDRQTSWTPWHDGDAQVTAEEAAFVAYVLDQLTDDEANAVTARWSDDEQARFTEALEKGSADASANWVHGAFTPLRWLVNEPKGWVETAYRAPVAFVEPLVNRVQDVSTPLTSDQHHLGGPYAPRGDGFQNLGAFGEASNQGLTELAAGNLPIVSNLSGCVLGDDASCLWLGGEVVIEGATGFVGGRVIGFAKGPLGKLYVRVFRGGRVTTHEASGEAVEEILKETGDDISPWANPQNNALKPKLVEQLQWESATSLTNPDGTLTDAAIAEAKPINLNGGLKNPKLVAHLTSDGSSIGHWAKFKTTNVQGPSGNFEVHFYMNKVTDEINYTFDYKSVVNWKK